jgi:probable addiction module antidote protein
VPAKTTSKIPPCVPFRTADFLRSDHEIAIYLEGMLEDGDTRLVPIALRTVADAVGGVPALATRTGLSREILYRTLAPNGNPRFDTLGAVLDAFGLRLTVAPKRKRRTKHDELRPEYKRSDFPAGQVRGKYKARIVAGFNIVVLEPKVAAAFPTSAAVNSALRSLMLRAGSIKRSPKAPSVTSGRRSVPGK